MHKLECSRFCLSIKKHFCTCVGDGALAHVAQKGYGVSSLEILPGPDPGLPALDVPALEGDKVTSRGPYRHQLFCEFGKKM